MLLTWKSVEGQGNSKKEKELFLHQEAWQLFNKSMRHFLISKYLNSNREINDFNFYKESSSFKAITDQKIWNKKEGEFEPKTLPIRIKRDCFNKPHLVDYPDIYFNLSHCKGMVACIIHSRPVGVDVEYMRDFTAPVMGKVCSIEEQNWIRESENPEEAFFRLWTLKESYIKTIGLGIQFPMKQVQFKLQSSGKIESNQKGYRFRQIKIGDTFILASCEKVKGE
ncbi:MAG: 4'-phosphopantetheinyl transferase superfamily protein [Cellulosilyticum sp.]|nr:4'-phosphopantetheinyl transferase superfamily protein [Cellulosilyticum sp.]